MLHTVFVVTLASWIEDDAPQRAGISLVGFECKTGSDISLDRRSQEPRHSVFFAYHALEECSVLLPETATPPSLAHRGVRLVSQRVTARVSIHTVYAPTVEASEDHDCGLDLLRDVVSDHRIQHRTQLHVLDHVVCLATGPQVLRDSVDIVLQHLIVIRVRVRVRVRVGVRVGVRVRFRVRVKVGVRVGVGVRESR